MKISPPISSSPSAATCCSDPYNAPHLAGRCSLAPPPIRFFPAHFRTKVSGALEDDNSKRRSVRARK
jgi:hypothetical protein